MSVNVMEAKSPIGRLVSRDAVRVAGEATLSEVASIMREANVSSVLVGGFGAIATERDLTRAVAAGLDASEPVAAVASTDPVRVASALPVVDAAGIMLNHEVRHLVIEYPDGSEAVISLRDVMAVLLQAASPEIWLESLRVAVTTPAEIWLGRKM